MKFSCSILKVILTCITLAFSLIQVKSQTTLIKKIHQFQDVFNKTIGNEEAEIDPKKYLIPEEYKNDIFSDDFSTNKNNWTMVIDERSFRKIENGYLNYWSYFTNDPTFWRSAFCLKNIEIDETKNFELEISVKCTQYGVSIIPLIWGRNTENLNTLYFGFTSKGEFQVLKFENNAFSNLSKLIRSDAIIPSNYNLLTLRKFGSKLYFFINKELVFQMPSINLPGHEFGFQAPSNSNVFADFIRMTYIGDLSYEKKVKSIVVNKYEKWLVRGKFEKTVDYELRVNQSTKNKMIARLVQEVIDSIGNTKNKFELLRNEYNPDHEMFKVYLKANDPIALNVPIKEASSFDENFLKLILNPRFTIENNTFPLVYMDFTNPQNKLTYSFRNQKETFDVRKIFPNIGQIDTVIIPKEILIQEIAKQEVVFQKQLADFTTKMVESKDITDNVKTNVIASVVEEKDVVGKSELNYRVTYSYEVIKAIFEGQTDDFPLGKYKVSTSNAAKLTLEVLKETVEKKLYKFLDSGTKVTVKITGSTDATPVNSAIKYDGEYGIFSDADCFVNDHLSTVNLSQNSGITSNEQLAFLRTYSVRQFIETYIDALRGTQNIFQHYCVISKEKGSQYRRVAIELTIHKAFEGKKASELFPETEMKADPKSDVDINIPELNVKNDKCFALIIGNENYKNEIQVPFAIHDAIVFKEYCLKTFGIPDNQIHYIENATFGQLQGEIKWLSDIIKAFKGEAKILLYYAGHGMPDENKRSPYILPVDGSSSIPATALELNELYAKLQEFKTNSITVFLDACFSGTSREGTLAAGRGVAIKPVENILRNNFIVFSATSNKETALPYKDKYHGMFTYFLLKKIKESKGDFNYNELFEFVKTNVNQQSILINQKTQMPSINISTDLQDSWKTLKINKK